MRALLTPAVAMCMAAFHGLLVPVSLAKEVTLCSLKCSSTTVLVRTTKCPKMPLQVMGTTSGVLSGSSKSSTSCTNQ